MIRALARRSASPRFASLASAFAMTLVAALAAVAAAGREPEIVRERTDQVEITAPAPLLDESGNLKTWGWARRAEIIYNRSAIPAALLPRVKEWEHYTIMSPEFTFGLTLVQLGTVTSGSFEVINYPGAEGPGGMGPGGFFLKTGNDPAVSAFPDNPHGAPSLAVPGGRVSFAFEGKTRRLSFDFAETKTSPAISGEIEMREDPAEDSVAITRPFEKPGHFFYENKIFGMAAKGSAKVGDKTYILPEGNAWAIFDWGRGIWPKKVGWFWGQAAGTVGGKRVAFNLGHGYGDDAKGTCNAVLVEGRLHKLDTVILDYDPADQMKPWKLSSNDGRLSLDFKPIFLQHSKQMVLIAATELNKVHGRFTGTLTLDDGSKVEIKDMLGFMEHAEHTW